MVLESLINPFKAEKKPYEMFFIGLVYSSIAIMLTLWVFDEGKSMAFVFLTVIAAIPMIYNTLKIEERKDLQIQNEGKLLKEHSKALSFFLFMFLGFLVSFVLWNLFLPGSVSQELFFNQEQTISRINRLVTSGSFFSPILGLILSNNIKVLFFRILFSFFYGAGAIFIFTWNASVIALAIGNFFRAELSMITSTLGLTGVSAYFKAGTTTLLRYMVHAIPEIVAYFIAGMAGGIISVAIARHDFRTKNFQKIVLDSSNLILIALAFLIVAAILEVYVTPLLF